MNDRTLWPARRIVSVIVLSAGLAASCTRLKPGADFPDASARDAQAMSDAGDVGVIFDARVLDLDGGEQDGSSLDASSPDGGISEDGGLPTSCTQHSDCGDPNAYCVEDFDGDMVECLGGPCQCVTACDFDRPFESCAPGFACAFAGVNGDIPNLGYCALPTGGGQHGAPCTVTPTGDDCEHGHACRTRTNSTSGLCVRRCSPSRPEVCPALGDFECIISAFGPSAGYCLRPQNPGPGDIGQPCARSSECQFNACLGFEDPFVTTACTQRCGELDSCPTGTHCLFGFCLLDCSSSENVCGDTNPGLECSSIGAGQVCFAHCLDDEDCPQPLTCDQSTLTCSI